MMSINVSVPLNTENLPAFHLPSLEHSFSKYCNAVMKRVPSSDMFVRYCPWQTDTQINSDEFTWMCHSTGGGTAAPSAVSSARQFRSGL